MLQELTKSDKGLILILIGFVLLLYSLGVITKPFILFLAAVCIIAVGFIMYGGIEKIRGMIQKK